MAPTVVHLVALSLQHPAVAYNCEMMGLADLRDLDPRSHRVSVTGTLFVPRSANGEELPPYSLHEEQLPEYSAGQSHGNRADPPTFALYMFLLGFILPLFWIVGACMEAIPAGGPRQAASYFVAWCPERTPGEQHAFERRLRAAEIKWSRRCLFAAFFLFVVGLALGLTIWAHMFSRGRVH